MQLVLHTGAHFTEEERLLKCLLRNKSEFADRGTAVPGPGRYRKLVRDTLNAMKEHEPALMARDVLLDAILDQENADRLILSNAHFFGPPKMAVRNGIFYPKATNKLARMTRIFYEDRTELFMALRNPATFVPAILKRVPDLDLRDVLGTYRAQDLRWSEMIARIRQEVPNLPITVWCNEDAPMIWGQIIREMSGMEHQDKIHGAFDLLASIMSKDGMRRFRSYLKSHEGMNEIQKRRVIAAFLEKFALEDAIEEELDLPGWTEPLVDELSDLYDEDVLDIQNMPGVTVISP